MPTININLLRNVQNIRPNSSITKIGDEFGNDLTLSAGRFLAKATSAEIQGQGPCIGLTLIGSGKNFSAHIDPKTSEIENYVSSHANTALDRKIAKILSKLHSFSKSGDDSIQAVITGGAGYNSRNIWASRCYDVLNGLYDTLIQRNKIPTSFIAAQRNPNCLENRVNTFVQKDKIMLYGGACNEVKTPVTSTLDSIQNNLDDVFEFVELDKNASFKID